MTLHRPVIDRLLFSLATAVGMSPQLLPAVVSTSLAAGSRQLARRKVLVKRLVCIEDLGNVSVLFTDKTGTLTEGTLRFMRSTGPDGMAVGAPLLLGLLCNEAMTEDGRVAGGNPLDVAQCLASGPHGAWDLRLGWHPVSAGRTGRGADRGDDGDGQRHPSQPDAASASGASARSQPTGRRPVTVDPARTGR